MGIVVQRKSVLSLRKRETDGCVPGACVTAAAIETLQLIARFIQKNHVPHQRLRGVAEGILVVGTQIDPDTGVTACVNMVRFQTVNPQHAAAHCPAVVREADALRRGAAHEAAPIGGGDAAAQIVVGVAEDGEGKEDVQTEQQDQRPREAGENQPPQRVLPVHGPADLHGIAHGLHGGLGGRFLLASGGLQRLRQVLQMLPQLPADAVPLLRRGVAHLPAHLMAKGLKKFHSPFLTPAPWPAPALR